MRFLTANTFYKFVNQFSFIGNKSHLKSITNEDLLWKIQKNTIHYVGHGVIHPVRSQRHVKMHINLTIGY